MANDQETEKAVPTSRKFADDAFRSRIGAAVERLGSLKAAAGATGVSVDTIARWQQGPTTPPFTGVMALCAAAGIRVEWLATGAGPQDIEPEPYQSASRTDTEHSMQMQVMATSSTDQYPHLIELPQLAVEASAGPGLIPMGEHVEGFVSLNEEYLREIGVNPRSAHVLRVSGRSMAPTINDRDVVIIDVSVRTPVSEGIYSLVYGDTVLLKRIRLQRDGGLILVSDNKSEGYADEVVPKSELASLSIVGRVKGHIRSL